VDQQRAQKAVTTFADPTKTASCTTRTTQQEQLRDLQWQLARAVKLKQRTAEVKQRMESVEVPHNNLPDFGASNGRF
jgi:hypothetical protein